MDRTMHIGGVSVRRLADALGTPLLVYDEGLLRKQLRQYREHLRAPGLTTRVIYAGKAFLCGEMARLAAQEGCGLDVVSGGELACALAAGFPAGELVFHGNNKTPAELAAALEAGVGTLVADNLPECRALAELARGRETPLRVLLRVNPGVEAHTHQYIVTAHPDSKFGIAAGRKEELYAALAVLRDSPGLSFGGFHAHIGSQIFDRQAFVEEIRQLALLAREAEGRGFPVRVLDLGGGFAARYTDADAPIPIPEVCRTILDACAAERAAGGLSLEEVWIEPGRSVAGEAGTTLYTVGWQKDTPARHYLFVDGGMADNIRPALYQAEYDCDAAEQMGAAKTVDTTVAGKCCESGDILIQHAMLPPMKAGELLAVYTTGAYCYSMASSYNHLGRPAVVFVQDGRARCVLRREEPADLMALECDREVAL